MNFIFIVKVKCILFQEIERVKEEQDEKIPVSVLEPKNSLATSTNIFSQFVNPTSFLFGDKSSIFDKPTPNLPNFGSVSIDSVKTDDTKSTNLFSLSSAAASPKVFGAFSTTPSLFSTLGSTESPQNTAQRSLFSKTDDNKSRTETFTFSPKTDSPFKFGVVNNKDPKSVFGQNLFSGNKSIDDSITPQGTNIQSIIIFYADYINCYLLYVVCS